MSDKDRVNFSIVTSRDCQASLSTLAKQSGLSQGEVIEIMLKFHEAPKGKSLEKMLKDRRIEKLCSRLDKNDSARARRELKEMGVELSWQTQKTTK